MHSLSNELLNMKVIHMTASVMATKRQKLLKCNRAELVTIDNEVRAELSQPWITDVLHSPHVSKAEIVNDIMSVVKNSVTNNFKTILKHG
jgi:hypothetical protein